MHIPKIIQKPSIALIIMGVIFLHLFNTVSVFAAGTLLLNVGLAPEYSAPFGTGDEVQFRISFSCNSLQVSCGDLLISSSLDPNLEIISFEVPTGFNSNIAGQDISLSQLDYQDGSAAEALVTVRIRESASPDVDISTIITGTITDPDDGVGVVTSALDIDVEPATFQWDVGKDLVGLPNGNPALDTNVTYLVEVAPDSLTGNLGMDTLTVVDTYPTGAIVVDATGSPAPIIDTINHTITWNYSNVTVASRGFSEEVTLLYSSSDFSVGATVLNSVSATGLPVSSSAEQFINEVGNNAPLSADYREAEVTKTQTGSPLGAGGIGRFFLELDVSNSNVALDGVVVGDTMPVDGLGNPVFDIVQIWGGSWSPAITAEIYICCDSLSNEAFLGTVDGSSNTLFEPADFPVGLTPDNITIVEWRFVDSIPVGFELFDSPEIVFTPQTGNDGSTFTNQGYADVSNSSVGSPNTSDIDTDILATSTNVLPVKNVLSETTPPNGILQFEAVLNVNEASNQPLDGLAIYDLLPPELEFVSWDAVVFSAGIPSNEQVFPNLTVTPMGNRTELIWTWGNTVPTGAIQIDGSAGVPNSLVITEPEFGDHTITIVFSTRVVPVTPAGTYNNELSFVSNVNTLICQGISTTGIDNNDIDGDGITAGDTTCSASGSFTVTQAAAMISSEWIQGDEDYPNIIPANPSDTNCPDDGTNTRFTRFPCVAQGEFNEPFLYKMRMQNAGNVPITDYIAYNILPYVGDAGSGQPLVSASRQTEWLAYITDFVTPNNAFTQGLDITIEYSDSINPCRPEVSSANNTNSWQAVGTCVDDWTAVPDDFADVRAFRIIVPFGAGNSDPFFQPAQEMEFIVPMLINGDADPETIAWNSFAQRASDAISGDLLETSEPRKVGILARGLVDDSDVVDASDGSVISSDNSGNTSDLSQSRIIGEGNVSKSVNPFFASPDDLVTWTITLRNPSNTALAFVGFDDSIPNNLSIISVDVSEGTVSIDGQVVEYRLDELAPNQTVTVEIVTRINSDIPLPFIIDNRLDADISAQVISVTRLPNTGETPLWRNVLLLSLALITVGGIGQWWLRRY